VQNRILAKHPIQGYPAFELRMLEKLQQLQKMARKSWPHDGSAAFDRRSDLRATTANGCPIMRAIREKYPNFPHR